MTGSQVDSSNMKKKNSTEKAQGAPACHARSSEVVLLAALVLLACIVGLVVYVNNSFPQPRDFEKDSPVDTFYEDKAKEHLRLLTSFGPKPTGSVENEQVAFRYLLGELNKLKPNPVQRLDIDVQRPNGSFTLYFIHQDIGHVYRNITNVIARIGPKGKIKKRHSLLINCHYDSVPGSPGASDDVVSCAVLLEILRALASSSVPLKHSVIFLFNGAEENILPASHGFITKHTWRNDIRAFLNLDSAGGGGRELVFQTGPKNPWLVHAYAKSVKYPFANSVSQEIFQSGIIPSDTDYRVFRDYGRVPGIDMAFVSNGYIYHTEYDAPEYIPDGAMQRAGENIMELIKNIANSSYLEDPQEYRHGDVVFFDVIGLFMVTYPARIATILNSCFVFLVLTLIWQKAIAPGDQGLTGLSYILHLIFAIVVIIFSWLVTIGVNVAMGYGLSALGHGMSWFTNPSLLFGIYACPAALTLLAVHSLVDKVFYFKRFPNAWDIEALYFEATLLLWTLLLMFTTYKESVSSYLPLLWVASPIVFRRFITVLVNSISQGSNSRLLVFTLLSLILPTLLTVYVLMTAFEVFTPMMGRMGSEINPDIFMSMLVALSVIIVTCYLVSLIHALHSVDGTTMVLAIMCVVSLGITIQTPFGFPYGSNALSPTPKRMFAQHVMRTFYDKSGAVWKEDAHLELWPLDFLGIDHVINHDSHFKAAEPLECIDNAPYCGASIYIPIKRMIRKSWSLPAAPIATRDPMKFKLVQKLKRSEFVYRLKFSWIGSEKMQMYIRPMEGVVMTKWSLDAPIPDKIYPGSDEEHEGSHFIMYSHGYAITPLEFWIELDITSGIHDESDGIVTIAVVANYLHDNDIHKSKELVNYLKKEPDWATTSRAVSKYESWVF
ncbi:endoplasmic reticulum metallopeptidase 1-like [Glandiceps talaboti]